ncbi:MAG: hypothetical protein PWR12_1218 [Eubacteriaceae bacterium]|jgi:uncharacterized protein YjdB|nr:hypothetical protein [Eubacteriaceae bacterium]
MKGRKKLLIRLMLAFLLIFTAFPTAILASTGLEVASAMPTLNYRTHIQNIGWQSWMTDGQTSGTSGQSLRLEAIEITTNNQGYNLGVEYQTHVQNIGWQDWKSDGQSSGTSGQGLRLEAIRISLTGADAANFDVYYRVHAQNLGWLGWAKNGEASGSAGFGYRLEAIQIVIVAHGAAAPGSTLRSYVSRYSMEIQQTQYFEYRDVYYHTQVYESWYQRPVFTDSSVYNSNFAAVYDNLEAAWVGSNHTDLDAFIYSYTYDPNFRNNLLGKYENTVTAAITYNNNNVFSIVQEQYTYSGGAHGNTETSAHTFESKYGAELSLGDLLSIPDTQISGLITNEFYALRNTDPAYADIDLSAIAASLNANSDFYLNDTGLVIYFNPYEVAPGAAGRVELTIPYSRSDLLNDIETLV